MPRRCTICHHPEREVIEKALVEGREGYRSIAQRFSVSESALYRHRKSHLPELLARAVAAQPVPTHRPQAKDPAPDEHALEIARHQAAAQQTVERQALDGMQQLKAINAACLEVLKQARASGQPALLLKAVDRIGRQIELQAKLLGQLEDKAVVNIAVLPEWQDLRHRVIEALRPYPEARLAVAEALNEAS